MKPNWRTNYVRYRSLFLNLVGQYKKRDDVKVYLELLLSLATVSIFAIFALRPTLLTISGLIKEIDAKKQTIEQMDSKIEDIAVAQRTYDVQRSKIDMLKSAIPSTADPDVVLRQIEGAVSDSGVEVRGFGAENMLIIPASASEADDSNKQKDSSENKEIKISISTTSDYSNLQSLVSTFENLRKPFNINSLRFAYTEQEDSATLTLTIDAGLPIIRKQNK